MGFLQVPIRFFHDQGSRLAIFLVKRRLKKRPQDLGVWILLSKLYQVRNAPQDAKQTLKLALKLFPGNALLLQHMEQLNNRPKRTQQG